MKKITLPQKMTTHHFYNHFLVQMEETLSHPERKLPTIDFSEVKHVDSLIIPPLLSTLQQLFTHFQTKIPLRFDYLSDFNPVFYNSGFFNQAHPYIEYDQSYFVGFSQKTLVEHELISLLPDNTLYELLDQQEDETLYQSNISYLIKYTHLEKHFKQTLKLIHRSRDLNTKLIQDTITELLCNSLLYSKSNSYALMSVNKYRFLFSISDHGVGFRHSLNKRNISMPYHHPEHEGLLDIITALKYAHQKEKNHLWHLKNNLVNHGGILCIHTQNTQIEFNDFCKGCQLEPDACLKCLLDRQHQTYEHSPLRIFKATLSGVHIEVEIPRYQK